MEEKISHSKRWTLGVIFVAIAGAVASIFRIDLFGEKPAASKVSIDPADLAKSDPALHLYKESAPRIQTGLDHAHLVAVDKNNAIYAAGGKQVKRFDSSGRPDALNIQTDGDVSAIEVADDGVIYLGVSDHIEAFTPNGQRIAQWDSVGDKGLITAIALS
ncbi:hypothetical protein K8I31_08600, partial [bacterium]|nr:hypothetical protein [bacterium]